MGIMVLMVILIFFALLGVANLLTSVGRWLSDSCPLRGCTLVVQPGQDAERAEALLLGATELLDYDPRLRELRLAVVCPPTAAARAVTELFCADREIAVFSSWNEVERQQIY